jgi:hypothetical protein
MLQCGRRLWRGGNIAGTFGFLPDINSSTPRFGHTIQRHQAPSKAVAEFPVFSTGSDSSRMARLPASAIRIATFRGEGRRMGRGAQGMPKKAA